jgi:glyoxylase-like metal-dependent hydrolase (beta-lactamase superfamily II)
VDRRTLLIRLASLAGAGALRGTSAATGPAMEVGDILSRAATAMGTDQLNTLRYSGRGVGAQFGQAYLAGLAWPRVNISLYVRSVDYKNSYIGEEFSRSRAEPRGGGPLPPVGEALFAGHSTANHAWNSAGIETSPHRPNEVAPRMHDLWTTPHGVIRAAAQAKPTLALRKEGSRTLAGITFTLPGAMTATAFLNQDYLVERIESRASDTVLGEVDVVTHYTNYRNFNGVMFPTRIDESRAGSMTLGLDITEVVPNAAVYAETPAPVASATDHVDSTEIARGVWFLAGSSHNSIAIEMDDHVVLVDAPLGDDRARAVLVAVQILVPGKSIRYAVNSHVHFDHAGGLRAVAAEGAAVVTHTSNVAYFERAFATPNNIAPDALTRSGRKVRVMGVDEKLVMHDATRTIEIYHVEGSVHSGDLLLVYLPNERLLIEGDLFHPPWPVDAPPPLAPDELAQELARTLERLKLGVDQILPLHGGIVPIADLSLVIGP